MSKKIDKPIVEGTFGKMQEVDDFLPSPDELVLKKPAKLVTLRLNSDSVTFFKKEGARLETPKGNSQEVKTRYKNFDSLNCLLHLQGS